MRSTRRGCPSSVVVPPWRLLLVLGCCYRTSPSEAARGLLPCKAGNCGEVVGERGPVEHVPGDDRCRQPHCHSASCSWIRHSHRHRPWRRRHQLISAIRCRRNRRQAHPGAVDPGVAKDRMPPERHLPTSLSDLSCSPTTRT